MIAYFLAAILILILVGISPNEKNYNLQSSIDKHKASFHSERLFDGLRTELLALTSNYPKIYIPRYLSNNNLILEDLMKPTIHNDKILPVRKKYDKKFMSSWEFSLHALFLFCWATQMDDEYLMEYIGTFYALVIIYPVYFIIRRVIFLRKQRKRTKEYMSHYVSFQNSIAETDFLNKNILTYNQVLNDYTSNEINKIEFINKSLQSRHTFYEARSVNQGISENYFLDILNEKYSSKVLYNTCIEQEHFSYVPDFLLQVDNIDLVINIEIDEPYTLHDHTPIHFDDSSRNDYFTKNDIPVIRFSERQIIEEADKCILTIDSFISYITSSNPTFNIFNEIDPSWDEDLSTLYINSKYRENYLSKFLKLN